MEQSQPGLVPRILRGSQEADKFLTMNMQIARSFRRWLTTLVLAEIWYEYEFPVASIVRLLFIG
jgi:hypothetical protein